MTVTLETPLSKVLGPKTAKGMAEQLNLHTVRHLLRHYPRRYARRGEMARPGRPAGRRPGDDPGPGHQREHAAACSSAPAPSPRSPSATAPARMKLVFFNYRHSGLKHGALGLFAGTVGKYQGQLQFTHPDMHLLSGDDDSDDDWARALVPIYPASKDVASWVIQKSVKLLLGASGGFARAGRRPAARGDAQAARAALAGGRPPRHPPAHDRRGHRARRGTG